MAETSTLPREGKALVNRHLDDLSSKDVENSDEDTVPLHPIPSMQGPFEESFHEAQRQEDWMIPIESHDACQRRETMLQRDEQSLNGTLNAQWRNKRDMRYHPLLKVLAQLVFGIDLIYSDNAQDDDAVMRVMRRHILDLHLYLKSLVEDLVEGLTDVCERTGYLKLTLEYEPVLEVMLRDPRVTKSMTSTISSIKRVTSYTFIQTDDAEMDVKHGREACKHLLGFLDDIAADCGAGTPLQRVSHAFLGQESGVWMQRFNEIEIAATRLRTATRNLNGVLRELETKIGSFEASKVKAVSSTSPSFPKVLVQDTDHPADAETSKSPPTNHASPPARNPVVCPSGPRTTPFRAAGKGHLVPRDPTYGTERLTDLVSFFNQTSPPPEAVPVPPAGSPGSADGHGKVSNGAQPSFSPLGFLAGSKILASISGSKPGGHANGLEHSSKDETGGPDTHHNVAGTIAATKPPKRTKDKSARADASGATPSRQPLLAVTSLNTYYMVEPGATRFQVAKPPSSDANPVPRRPKHRRRPTRTGKSTEVKNVTSPSSVLQASHGWLERSDDNDGQSSGQSDRMGTPERPAEKPQEPTTERKPSTHSTSGFDEMTAALDDLDDYLMNKMGQTGKANAGTHDSPTAPAPQPTATALKSDSRAPASSHTQPPDDAHLPSFVGEKGGSLSRPDGRRHSPSSHPKVLTPVSAKEANGKDSVHVEMANDLGKYAGQAMASGVSCEINSPLTQHSGVTGSMISSQRSTQRSRSTRKRSNAGEVGKQSRSCSNMKLRTGSVPNTKFGLFPTLTPKEQALEQTRRSLNGVPIRSPVLAPEQFYAADIFTHPNFSTSPNADRSMSRNSSRNQPSRLSYLDDSIGPTDFDLSESHGRVSQLSSHGVSPRQSGSLRAALSRNPSARSEGAKERIEFTESAAGPVVHQRSSRRSSGIGIVSPNLGEQRRRSISGIVSHWSRQSFPSQAETVVPAYTRTLGSVSGPSSSTLSSASVASDLPSRRPSFLSLMTVVRGRTQADVAPSRSVSQTTVSTDSPVHSKVIDSLARNQHNSLPSPSRSRASRLSAQSTSSTITNPSRHSVKSGDVSHHTSQPASPRIQFESPEYQSRSRLAVPPATERISIPDPTDSKSPVITPTRIGFRQKLRMRFNSITPDDADAISSADSSLILS